MCSVMIPLLTWYQVPGRFCGKFYPVIVMGTGANNVLVDVHTCKWFNCANR